MDISPLIEFLGGSKVNFLSVSSTLKEYLNDYNILGVQNFDTRAITRFIRDKGAQKAILTTSEESVQKP